MNGSECQRLQNKVAVVTGGGTGIGFAIARRLFNEGARVAIVEINPDLRQRLHAEFPDQQAVQILDGDVTKPADLQRAVDEAVSHFGSLDIWINNVGAALRKPVADYAEGDWQAMLDLNLTSVFDACRIAHPALDARSGAIVNIASMHALFTVRGVSAYAAAKGGVVALTRALALEFSPSVRVNAVLPGLIETESWLDAINHSETVRAQRKAIHPLGRIGRPEDIAGAVAFLASADAAFITGAAIPVDGGLTIQLYRE